MAYPNRTPEEQAAIEQRKYRAWNDLRAGARRMATPAAEALAGGLANPAVNLATAVVPNLPRFDFRPPGAEYTPERTAGIVQDFRSALPGPAAGKPTFADRRPMQRPTATARPGALDALLQQSPLTGPRELTAEGLVSRRPTAMVQAEDRTMPAGSAAGRRRSPQAIAQEGRETLARFGTEPRSAVAVGQEGRNTLAGLDQPTRAAAVLGPAAAAGQGWAQFENGPRYEVDQGRVRKLDAAGREQPLRGAVNVLTPEETRNLFGPRAGAGDQGVGAAPPGPAPYDPDQLAAAQFGRIKSAADALMAEAHNTPFDDVRAAKYKAAQALYAQIGGVTGAGVAAGGGIAQEGVRGRSFLAQQQIQNQGALQEQQARNTGAYDVQRLQGEQAVDIEELKNQGLLSREALVNAREAAKQKAEREDRMAERMGMTTYDPETGMPMGQVPTPKYDYGSKPAQQAFQPGQTYRHRDGSVYRYNGGDIDDPKSWSKL